MFRHFLLIVLFFYSLNAFSQNAENKKLSDRKNNRAVMKSKIMQLKNGVLLIRLQSKKKSTDALRALGENERAEYINENQQEYNKNIIAAFRESFNFCPVYFFYSEYSHDVISGNMENIIFLDDSLKSDSAIRITSSDFLVADFGLLEQDTSKKFSVNYLSSGKNGPEMRQEYNGGPNMRFPALRILSEKLVQLKRPFPYYVKTYELVPFKKKKMKVVRKLNRNLLNYSRACGL